MKTMMFAAAAAMLAAAPAAAQELLTNGNFETGTFAGWSNQTQPGSSGGIIISTPGSNVPQGFATASNASGGSFYAVSQQTGPGAYALSQGFFVPIGTTSVTLSFQSFVNNRNPVTTVNPGGLDYSFDPNQHARIDLLTAGADPFSTAAGDVLANFYLGADPFAGNPNPYVSYTFDLSALVTAGQGYQIRFAEVDNQGFFNLGVDNVSVFAAGVPEPASWALMIGGFGLVGGALRRRVRTTVAYA